MKFATRPVCSFCRMMWGIVTVRFVSRRGRQKVSVIRTAVAGTARMGYSPGVSATALMPPAATRTSAVLTSALFPDERGLVHQQPRIRIEYDRRRLLVGSDAERVALRLHVDPLDPSR